MHCHLLRFACAVGIFALAFVLTANFVSGAASAATDPGIPSPSDRAPLPVPYTALSGVANEIHQPGAPLAGSNDWACRPDAEKPNPVILLHGRLGADSTNWATFGPLLHNAGYCVFSLTFGAQTDQGWPLDRIGGIDSVPESSAPQVADFARRVLDETGSTAVDLVGYSQGTIVAGYLAKYHLEGQVGAVVSLAPLWGGSDAGPEEAGGAGLPELFGRSGTPYAPGVEYTNIVTRYDQIVLPYTSGLLEAPPGSIGYEVRNLVLQDGCEESFADHVSILGDPRAADLVLDALDPGSAPTPRCEFVLPLHGLVGGPAGGS